MRLESLRTENYRSLQDLRLEFTENYCTISGRNNAGKSCVIRLLTTVLESGPAFPWRTPSGFDYKEDKTQWTQDNAPIGVEFSLKLARDEDPALISFVEKITGNKISTDTTTLAVRHTVDSADNARVSVSVDGARTAEADSKEIDKRIKDSNLLFLYNSTTPTEAMYFGRGRSRMFYEFVLSASERGILTDVEKYVAKKLKKVARGRTEALTEILGRLTEKYDVKVSPPEGFATGPMPLGINLADRNVNVPLDDWGSGTQNRTRILMAILQANRIKTSASPDEKITPIVVIEEPESFLHPSAQGEFGRMLRDLSREFGIQIIVTTHSPYMLNHENPTANILLSRRTHYKKAYETRRIPTDGENWMMPFADHLVLQR